MTTLTLEKMIPFNENDAFLSQILPKLELLLVARNKVEHLQPVSPFSTLYSTLILLLSNHVYPTPRHTQTGQGTHRNRQDLGLGLEVGACLRSGHDRKVKPSIRDGPKEGGHADHLPAKESDSSSQRSDRSTASR